MENGDLLVTEIQDAWISRVTREGKGAVEREGAQYALPIRRLPHRRRQAGHRGGFLEARSDRDFDLSMRKVTWEYFVKEGEGMLDHCSIAREENCRLSETGDILVVDDLHDRVMVIDRKTKAIIWQYGVTGKKGHTPGLL